jgi:predicted CXXCH cytochrome family protein
VAGRPSTKKCLSCHSGAQAKSAEEEKLQAFGENGREIPWQRVWRLPPHVFFSHRVHVAVAKVKCQTCHGPMETLTRPPPRPLKALTMDDCIGCHERWQRTPEAPAPGTDRVKVVAARKVSTDCNACHR